MGPAYLQGHSTTVDALHLPAANLAGLLAGKLQGCDRLPRVPSLLTAAGAALTTNRSECCEHCTSLNIFTAGPTQFPNYSLPPLHSSHLPKCTNNAAEKWRPVCGAPSRQHTH